MAIILTWVKIVSSPGNSFADATQGRSLYAQVRGNMIQRNRIEDVGLVLDEIEIAFFRGFENESFYARHYDVERFLRNQATGPFPFVRTFVQLHEVGNVDLNNSGVGERLRVIVARDLVNEALERNDESVCRVQENIFLFTGLRIDDVRTECAFYNKAEVLADVSLLIVVLAFFVGGHVPVGR